MSRHNAEGPLAGIRVLDFSAMIAGPYCTRLLADAGAEVIKLEPPEGDYMRGREPMKEGSGLYFGVLNAGKRSVAIDLKNPRGAALALELAAHCDVLLENFRPGVMQRLGLGSEKARAANPRLVYCSISGYGQQGAHSALPAYAPIVQAASGYDLANLGYQRGIERPLNTGIFAADYLTGVHAFGAICAALVRRARTGAGETIDCALMDSMLGMLGYEVAEAQAPVSRPRQLYQATRAKDGFLVITPITQANFEAMARAAGHPEWLADPRFAGTQARGANWDALMAALDAWAADKSAAECEAVMAAGGVPCARYRTVKEAMASPYAAERGLFSRVSAGKAEFLAPNPPYRMDGVRAGARVPALGEDGPAVLENVLKRSAQEIARLAEDGVLCRPA
jgi:crotonobetainyl-CoA:carnitine CoA-transferase CaiB-like acyl-CoA transferase